MSEITVERRAEREGDAVCAYCRAPFEGEAQGVTCDCGARLHRDCLALNGGRCTTVGCGGGGDVRAAASAVGAKPAEARARRPRWRTGVLALGLAAALLAAARPDRPREELSYWRDRWRLSRGTPEEVVAVLWAVGDEDGPARSGALRALHDLDDPGVNAALVEHLRHPDRWTRLAAADALAWNQAKDPRTLRVLLEALRDETWPGARAALTRALAEHTRAFPAEADAVTASHPDPAVRRLAGEVLPAR